MKKLVAALLAFMLCILLPACDNAGEISNAEIDYGSSVLFSEAEIKSAVEVTLTKFKSFYGCDLLRLWYDESRSVSQLESYLIYGRGADNGVERDNVIILFSDFYVGHTGGESAFNRDFTYTDWMWILIRNRAEDEWIVDDWGY